MAPSAPAGNLARAAARGVLLNEMLEQAARDLLQRVAADRAVVWLKPAWPGRFHPPILAGPGEPRTAPGSCHLDPLLPLWSEAGSTREPIFLVAGEDSSLPFLGPLAGMRAAILVPIWGAAGPLGIALAAWKRAVTAPDLEPLERLAEELALVVARERAEERAEHALRQSAEIVRLSRLLLPPVPAAEALREIVPAARRLTGAAFVAIVRASLPLECDVCDPENPAARSRFDEEEITRAACVAAAEGRPVEVLLPVRELEGSGTRTGIILRVVAHPLEGPRCGARILLARRERIPAGMVQRLETIADLAVRLRETVRRLSDAWEERRDDPVHSA